MRKEVKKVFAMGVLASVFATASFSGSVSKVEAAENQEVKIDSQNFPDAVFRASMNSFDKDKNGILSQEEISKVTSLTINSYDYDKEISCDVDITGVEKLSNLQYVKLYSEKKIIGSLKKNTKLKVVDIAENASLTWKEYEAMLPVEQLEILMISKDSKMTKISLPKNDRLDCLSLTNCKKLKKLDVKNLKNLEELTVNNTAVNKLDLRKNKKLKKLYIQSGQACVTEDITKGKNSYKDLMKKYGSEVFYQKPKTTCDIRLPKNNKITDLDYFVKNKELDLSECKKLSQVNINGSTTLKAKNTWYKARGTKVDIYAGGLKQKIKKCNVQTQKGYTYIKAAKKDKNKYSYCTLEEYKKAEEEWTTEG